ncbi:hypothetical protein HOH87_02760 [bacterium]|jgi:signal transduction histidine kinase|nr:hypothetical protein [bacterium]
MVPNPPKKTRIWTIFFTQLIIIVVTIIAVILMANQSFKSFYIDRTTNELRSVAQLISHSTQLESHSFGRLRITIIAPNGVVTFDSAEFLENMENHLHRPEVQSAINGQEGIQTRYSDTLKETMLYLTAPVYQDGTLAKIVRVSVPITDIHKVLNRFYFNLSIGGLLIVILSGSVTFFMSRRMIDALQRRHENEVLVSKLKKLEKMRKEFVGNVSHELRTPITLIKGFIETLQDGASENPADSKKFLGIIHTHSERLTGIIDDLLTLSKIEMEEDNTTLELIEVKLKPVLARAIQICTPKASEKNVSLHLTCSADLKIRMAPPLIEQAVVNLIDNAIKFSPKNSTVSCIVAQEKSITIEVKDTGAGIESEHLPRLFQRFYRVDNARSRNQGGTGLGLAIVKHIAQAHGGSVRVKSTVGLGSSFFIELPLQRI